MEGAAGAPVHAFMNEANTLALVPPTGCPQIRHFGFRILNHTWDLLDLTSVALVVASITLHFSCTSGVSPLTLRGLAAVQVRETGPPLLPRVTL